MDKVYRGRFWGDDIWLSLILGILGVLLIVVPLGLVALSASSAQGNTFRDLLIRVAPMYLVFLAAGVLCFYYLRGKSRERIEVGGGTLRYTGPFSTRRIPALDIDRVLLFRGERPIIIYEKSGVKKELRLPRWESSGYADDLLADLRRMNPNIEVLDTRIKEDEEGRFI